MSVRSKALRFGTLFGTVVFVAGCAMNANNPSLDSSIESADSSSREMYGDMAAADAPTTMVDENVLGVSDTVVEESEPVVVAKPLEARELLGKTEDGLAVRLEQGPTFSKVLIETAQNDPVIDVLTLDHPARLVVDVLGEQGVANKEMIVENDSYISGLRLGAHSDRTRLVFDLSDAMVEHKVDTETGAIEITFGSESAAAMPTMAQAEAPVAVEAMPEDLMAVEEPVVEEVAVADELPLEVLGQEAVAANELSLDTLTFQKTNDDSGHVLIGLSDKVAFELKRTAPSEFILRVPGAEAAQRTTLPLIAPQGFPGIRSARAVQRDGEVLVRMFVDKSVELQAVPLGNEIKIEARLLETAGVTPVAARAEARAQFDAPEEEGAEAAESGEDETRANPTGIVSADGSKTYTGRLISLDLQDTDIDNALRIIAEVSNLNIIASDDVSGKVTLRLIDVPWDQALDVILKTNGLDQVTEGNVIRIAPVDKLRQEREALREAKRAAQNLEDLTVKYLRVSYARVSEMVDQVQSVLSERGTVAEDERTNQLIVKDIKKGHEQAIELVKRLDLRTPQVLLETQIIEGQRNILRDLGFQWNFNYTASPATGNATGQNFPNTVVVGGGTSDAGGNASLVNFPAVLTDAAGSAISAVLDSADGSRSLSARLSALETEGKVRVVSRPQVATVNNKTAEIKSVETVRVRLPDSGTSVATGSGASAQGGGRTAFEEIDVGIQLTVTPQASPDYYVLMDIETRSSTFGSTVVDNIPSTLERQATSTILVKSGQTFALGGVYRLEDTDQVQGVPFLKDMPFIGQLFRRSFVDKSDEELIFFITPHIVEGSFDPSLM